MMSQLNEWQSIVNKCRPRSREERGNNKRLREQSLRKPPGAISRRTKFDDWTTRYGTDSLWATLLGPWRDNYLDILWSSLHGAGSVALSGGQLAPTVLWQPPSILFTKSNFQLFFCEGQFQGRLNEWSWKFGPWYGSAALVAKTPFLVFSQAFKQSKEGVKLEIEIWQCKNWFSD